MELLSVAHSACWQHVVISKCTVKLALSFTIALGYRRGRQKLCTAGQKWIKYILIVAVMLVGLHSNAHYPLQRHVDGKRRKCGEKSRAKSLTFTFLLIPAPIMVYTCRAAAPKTETPKTDTRWKKKNPPEERQKKNGKRRVDFGGVKE